MTPLVCPYCGSELEAYLGTEGSSYMSYEFIEGIQCDNWKCNAEWDKFGSPKRESKLND